MVVRHSTLALEMRRHWPRVTVGIGTWISVGGEGKEHSPFSRALEDRLAFLDSEG